ncbi:MAG: DASS family sodium-coupled anion symporter [Gemmatimonadetes bacterium]|nr:DASS family sodium-coupled anion symporter [Gemmatimonadota bacterium]
MSDEEARREYGTAQRLGLLGGGLLFLVLLALPAPEGMSIEAWRTAIVAILMAIWWMTEAIPIPATAMLPLVLFPVLGVLSMPSAAEPYANELIFLFMGGFFLAVSMQRWELHRRIALGILGAVGTQPGSLVFGFMLATAFLSMWISNTATAAMMLPIALAVSERFRPKDVPAVDPDGPPHPFNFGTALMLGLAYAANIGGLSTLIGTPPNAVLAGAADEMLGIRIGFLEWMMVGVPISAFMLPVTWLLLVRVLYPPGTLEGDAGAVIASERQALGRMSRGERVVAVVFVLTALSWVFREPKDMGFVRIPGLADLSPLIRDSTIAMAAAVLLFLLPINLRKGQFALDWEHARRIPWGVLLLFGGGLSLARAMDDSGLAAWIGGGVVGLAGVPTWVLILAVAALFVFLTEMTSNTATSTMAMPIMAGAAVGVGSPPLVLMATAALGASMAFMLPVATPPNAIVFGSGFITIPQMAKAGLWLNIISITVITVAATFLVVGVLVR